MQRFSNLEKFKAGNLKLSKKKKKLIEKGNLVDTKEFLISVPVADHGRGLTAAISMVR